MNRQALKKYGWQDAWETQIGEGGYPARVIRQDHDLYRVAGAKGELNAHITGKMMYEAASEADYPAVGDWVVIDRETDEAARLPSAGYSSGGACSSAKQRAAAKPYRW